MISNFWDIENVEAHSHIVFKGENLKPIGSVMTEISYKAHLARILYMVAILNFEIRHLNGNWKDADKFRNLEIQQRHSFHSRQKAR